MSSRKLSLLAAAFAAIVAVPALATLRTEPEGRVRGFPPTRRTVAFRDTAIATIETRWRKVEGLEVLVQARGPSTARFSGDFAGGPVEIRILRLRGHVLGPGIARFAPSEDSSSFSYDFVDPRRSGDECRRYVVSWRSPTGAEVTLNHGSLAVDYRLDEREPGKPHAVCID